MKWDYELSRYFSTNFRHGTVTLIETNLEAFFEAKATRNIANETALKYMILTRYPHNQEARKQLFNMIENQDIQLQKETTNSLQKIIWKVHQIDAGSDAPDPPQRFKDWFHDKVSTIYQNILINFEESLKADKEPKDINPKASKMIGDLRTLGEKNKHPVPYFLTGISFMEFNRFEDAVEVFEKAVTIANEQDFHEKDDPLLDSLGGSIDGTENQMTLLEEVKKKPARISDLFFYYGNALLQSDRLDEALNYYDHVKEIKSNYNNMALLKP